MFIQNALAILAKEFKSDFRNPYVVAGSGLFLLSTSFVCYIALKRISPPATWTALFWIVLLFASFNTVAKSFVHESRPRMLNLYTLVHPAHYIAGKMMYHALVMVVLTIIALVLFLMLFPIEANDPIVFASSAILGSIGFAFILSLLSSIASKAGNNLTLLAVLGLPVMLPLVLVNVTLMKNALDGIALTVQYKYLFVSGSLSIVCFALSLVLFPYLWRE